MATEVIEDDREAVEELNMLTRMTTRSMQMETGVMILMSSSPRESRRLLGLGVWSIFLGFKSEFCNGRGMNWGG